MKIWKPLLVLFAASGAGAPLAVGCDTPASPPMTPVSGESVGAAAEPIDLATCNSYPEKNCRKKAPQRCNKKGMPDGQGWDRCKWKDPKWDPKATPPDSPNCASDKKLTCPDPPAGGCVQAIFGRLEDSQKYYGCKGYIVINLPPSEWSQDVNDYYEDCILYGAIANLCDPPMKFVSTTTWNPATPKTGIPDYDASITDTPPGQITAREICRAIQCHGCTMKGRKGGGYIPTGCKNFTPPAPPKAPGKLKKTSSRTAAFVSDPTQTCSIDQYTCVPCDPTAGGPFTVVQDEVISTGGAGGAGGGAGAGGAPITLYAARLAVVADTGGSSTGGSSTGGSSTGGASTGGASTGGAGTGGSAGDDGDGICGSCDVAAVAPPADGVCETGETGTDCTCVADEFDIDDPSEFVDDDADGGVDASITPVPTATPVLIAAPAAG
jgi:hypothetical protein